MASARSSRKDLLGRILPGSPQVLLTRTCTKSCKNLLQQRGLHQDLHKIFLEGPVQDLFEDVSRIFARSCHKDLHKIMQGPLTGLQQGLRNIFSQGPQQDLGQYISYNYHGPPRLHHLQDRHSRTFQRIHIFIRSDLFTRISGNQLKSAPRQTKSDSTRAKCREGCATYVKIRTAPQRERSDKHKVTRGLREHFHKTVCAPRNMNMNIEHVKKRCFPMFYLQ